LRSVFSVEGLLVGGLANLLFVVQAIPQAFSALPHMPPEAAWVSGLVRWRTFVKIELPLAWPGQLAGAHHARALLAERVNGRADLGHCHGDERQQKHHHRTGDRQYDGHQGDDGLDHINVLAWGVVCGCGHGVNLSGENWD
jgi:hypothetical protein